MVAVKSIVRIRQYWWEMVKMFVAADLYTFILTLTRYSFWWMSVFVRTDGGDAGIISHFLLRTPAVKRGQWAFFEGHCRTSYSLAFFFYRHNVSFTLYNRFTRIDVQIQVQVYMCTRTIDTLSKLYLPATNTLITIPPYAQFCSRCWDEWIGHNQYTSLSI